MEAERIIGEWLDIDMPQYGNLCFHRIIFLYDSGKIRRWGENTPIDKEDKIKKYLILPEWK